MREITPQEVETLLKQGKSLNILDVREVAEVAEGKIPGAVNLPLGWIEFRMYELDSRKEYIVVCRSGGRSASAVQFLEGKGFNVINMQGGMLAWTGEVE
ncbi:rhodanese-like domain-containing protein [Ectobacillus sp. JY-23]|uniref:rhodanese-like domain-containing protein n=1 Tax=Ectobacillus sp. JY-23 TaxID=2933872 RepID=UPI001FF13329|nr:rhodanese-like domain-containing protein [Ectobacillus sp. JY-23]UOY93133.1 rhodanese-like domain-containing protein [Ectobacillus sp. JY-23]